MLEQGLEKLAKRQNLVTATTEDVEIYFRLQRHGKRHITKSSFYPFKILFSLSLGALHLLLRFCQILFLSNTQIHV